MLSAPSQNRIIQCDFFPSTGCLQNWEKRPRNSRLSCLCFCQPDHHFLNLSGSPIDNGSFEADRRAGQGEQQFQINLFGNFGGKVAPKTSNCRTMDEEVRERVGKETSRKYFSTSRQVLKAEKWDEFVIFRLIMDSNMKAEKVQNIEQLQQQTQEAKSFVQELIKIDYVNTSKIFYQTNFNSPEVKINNYLCYQQGQNLCKVTEIIYQDKTVRIQDSFLVTLNQINQGPSAAMAQQRNEKMDKNCSRTIQKVRIFNKNDKQNSKLEKKDKKNIVKNIVKIFLSQLSRKSQHKDISQSGQALEEMKKLIGLQNFNNRLIQKMTRIPEISKIFLAFLEDSAEDEIKYSRIQDKQSHYEALKIYRNLFNKHPSSLNGSESAQTSHIIENESYSESRLQLNKETFQNQTMATSIDSSGSYNTAAGFKFHASDARKSNVILVHNGKQLLN